MILLQRVTLSDFLSHEGTTVTFKDGQKLLLSGDSGSGKSSIFEAIIWALYGTGRSDNKSLVRRGAKKATVVLTLFDAEKTYEIERSITAGGKHVLAVRVDGIAHPLTGVRELQAWIEEDLIGASYLLFVNSIAYLQGGAETFVTQTAPRRKELLLEIVKTGDFDVYYKQASKLINSLKEESVANDREIENTEKWIVETKQKAEERPLYESKLTATKEQITAKQEEWSKLSLKDSENRTYEARIRTADSIIAEYQSGCADIERSLSEAEEAKASLKSLDLVALALEPIDQRIAVLTRDISLGEASLAELDEVRNTKIGMFSKKPLFTDTTGDIEYLEKEIQKLKDTPDCPSGDLCPYMKDKLSDIARLQDRKGEVEETLAKNKEALAAWQEVYDALPDADGYGELSQTITKKKGEKADLIEERHNIEMKLSVKPSLQEKVDRSIELERKLSEKKSLLEKAIVERNELAAGLDPVAIAKIAQDVAAAKAAIGELQKEESTIAGEIKFIDKLVAGLDTATSRVSELKDSNKTIETNINRLSLVQDAFGPKGIKTMVIDYILPNLEERINEILAQMSDFRVHLDTQQEKSSGDGNKEGLFITIINEMAEEMPFENYSGGEKLKIVVAISEALSSMQKVGFRLFDEVFVGLDENSTESFAAVLERLQSRFSQVLCISHLPQIKDMFEDKFHIVKHDGISAIIETT